MSFDWRRAQSFGNSPCVCFLDWIGFKKNIYREAFVDEGKTFRGYFYFYFFISFFFVFAKRW